MDQATATGNTYRKYGEVWNFFEICYEQTDRQTDKETNKKTNRHANRTFQTPAECE